MWSIQNKERNYVNETCYHIWNVLTCFITDISIFLRRARQMGDYLIVGLSTDEFNWNENRRSVIFLRKRKQLLEAIRYVDLVIPEENWEQKRTDVKEYHVDTFVMGDDWKGKFDFLKEEGCEVVYLPRTPEISSSQIKEDLHTKESKND